MKFCFVHMSAYIHTYTYICTYTHTKCKHTYSFMSPLYIDIYIHAYICIPLA